MTDLRRVYDVDLWPVLGSTFQPTGFPDLGAATFDRWEGEDAEPVQALLVESVQSMANRLEATTWDAAKREPMSVVDGMPWVRVVREGGDEFLTSSRLEAHRLFSSYIRDSAWGGTPGEARLVNLLGLKDDTPLDYGRMARTIMTLDPFSLIHGVFFAGQTKKKKGIWPAQPKFTRAVSAVVEAHNVRRAVSGGRKSELVRHQLDEEAQSGGTEKGYGSVPFHRVEWTARRIVASFVVDVELLRSYGLPPAATELLETVALWEIRALLSGGLRLRTACDLEVVDEVATRRGQPLPSLDELSARVRDLISRSEDSLGDGKPITVQSKG
jgi:CRISPR-associated protein Csb1